MNWFISLGYLGLFLGATLAGTVFPLSSDIIIVGVLIAGGDPLLCVLSAALGNATGTMISYGMGWLGKWKWLEKFNIKREKLEKQKAYIEKFGVWAGFFSWLPVIGTLSVIALGFYKVKPKTTTVLVLVGHLVRYTVLTLLYVNYGTRLIEWLTR